MTPSTSVIVVSHGRPHLLARCLVALLQSDHPSMEIVVVADAAGLAAVAAWTGRIKMAAFEAENISSARNAGLALAAGEVVAFIDDDAVAEPTWARRLAASFADRRVVAATGWTRGRDGFRYEARARQVDRQGRLQPFEGVGPQDAPHGGAVATLGTNAAFRRATLIAIGGFDPALRYFLDDSDVNLRLARLGQTAVVPDAEVQHDQAPGPRRTPDRAPRTLHDVGASTAVFLRRHAAADALPKALGRLRRQSRARLLRHLVAGNIEPGDVARLLRSLDRGIADGRGRPQPELSPLTGNAPPFLRIPPLAPGTGVVLAGWGWTLRRRQRQAIERVAAGRVVTLVTLGGMRLRPRMSFDPRGFWQVRVGLVMPIAGRPERRVATIVRMCERVRPVSAPFEP